jgi:nicotinate phosphoribosyltransferase
MANRRLDISAFDLPIHELRHGYRSDVYFNRSKMILENDNHNPVILMQVFQKKNAILCGVDEAIAIIRYGAGFYKERDKADYLFDRLISLKNEIRAIYHSDKREYFKKIDEKNKLKQSLETLWESSSHLIEIKALHDGDSIAPFESVLNIEGNAGFFIHLETLYIGALARRTRVATNVRRVVEAANGKPVLFFPARFDLYANQEGDGLAAKIGGATLVSTDAQGALWGGSGAGTIPHSLIACYGGDTVESAVKFATHFKKENCIALVDWENDCVKTSLEVAKKLKDKLYGVRLDTSDTMVDKSVQPLMAQFSLVDG